jgi:hypothetical protein
MLKFKENPLEDYKYPDFLLYYNIYLYMFQRLKEIMTYYDSEPMEIMHGIVWFIFFPLIHSFEFGINLLLIIPSVLIGIASIKSACVHSLSIRKIIGLAGFLFSIAVITYYILSGKLPKDPTHWMWLLIVISSFFNLVRLTNQYYLKRNGSLR